MSRTFLCMPLFTTLAFLSAAAAQEPAVQVTATTRANRLAAADQQYQQLAKIFRERIPGRELRTVTVPLESFPAPQGVPKVVETKWSATITLMPGGVTRRNAASLASFKDRLRLDEPWSDLAPPEVRQLQYLNGAYLFHPAQPRPGIQQNVADSLSAHLRRLAKTCPPELRPSTEIIDSLCKGADESTVHLNPAIRLDIRSAMPQINVRVFANSDKEAQAYLEALLRLYDYGFSRPTQAYFLGEGQKSLAQLQRLHKDSMKIEAEFKVEADRLATPSDISPEILSQLKAQKLMVAVEAAGLAARVKACDAMLNEAKKLEISTLQSVSDVKVKAEIELAGNKEKLDQLNKFIAEGDERQKARERQKALSAKLRALRGDIEKTEQDPSRYAELFALYAPFQVQDNQISVGPIEWTKE